MKEIAGASAARRHCAQNPFEIQNQVRCAGQVGLLNWPVEAYFIRWWAWSSKPLSGSQDR
jgi:hypothetical protein